MRATPTSSANGSTVSPATEPFSKYVPAPPGAHLGASHDEGLGTGGMRQGDRRNWR